MLYVVSYLVFFLFLFLFFMKASFYFNAEFNSFNISLKEIIAHFEIMAVHLISILQAKMKLLRGYKYIYCPPSIKIVSRR